MVSVSKPIPTMGLVSVARLIHSFVVASSLNTKHTSCTNTCLLVLACTILVDSTQQFASCYGPWRWNIIKIVGRPRRDRGISDSSFVFGSCDLHQLKARFKPSTDAERSAIRATARFDRSSQSVGNPNHKRNTKRSSVEESKASKEQATVHLI